MQLSLNSSVVQGLDDCRCKVGEGIDGNNNCYFLMLAQISSQLDNGGLTEIHQRSEMHLISLAHAKISAFVTRSSFSS